jgi:hypothetical protein
MILNLDLCSTNTALVLACYLLSNLIEFHQPMALVALYNVDQSL